MSQIQITTIVKLILEVFINKIATKVIELAENI